MASSTEERAVSLLGQGLGPEVVASALGVSVSRISQLLSQESFAGQVAELRFTNLAAHSERDRRADRIEDLLLERLENILPYLVDPMKILAAYTRINAAKRRGVSSPEVIPGQQTIVNLTIPTVIMNQYTQNNLTMNAQNQVVKVGEKDLVTIQSGKMDSMLSARILPPVQERKYVTESR